MIIASAAPGTVHLSVKFLRPGDRGPGIVMTITTRLLRVTWPGAWSSVTMCVGRRPCRLSPVLPGSGTKT